MKNNKINIITLFFVTTYALSVFAFSDEPTVDTPIDTPTEKTQSVPPLPELFEKCNYIFSTYVDEDGDVDYATLRRKRNELNEAIKAIEQITLIQYLAWDENYQKAFLINAHNIFTLKLVVDNYPIKPVWYMINYPSNSFKHIESGRAREKVFFDIMKHEYTLREIEMDILLGGFEQEQETSDLNIITGFDDLRVIFALSYASKSSAFLRNEVYLPKKLDEQLDDQVRKFVNSNRGVIIDHSKKLIYLSGIFKWYKNCFLMSKYSRIKKFRDQPDDIRSYLNFIVEYTTSDIDNILDNPNYSAKKTLPYSWQLNDAN